MSAIIINLNEYRHRRNAQALRIASNICARERRIREHELACIEIDKFYGQLDKPEI